jgi:hypothetical protein
MSKRKATAPRTKGDQLSRAGVRDYSPAQVRRALDFLIKHTSDPLAGYEIGRLRLANVLTDNHVAVAARFADLAKLWMRVHGVPDPSASAQDVSRVRGMSTNETSAEQAKAIKEAWQDAYMVLVSAGGDGLHRLVYDVIVRDVPCTFPERAPLVIGLAALHNHWYRGRAAA